MSTRQIFGPGSGISSGTTDLGRTLSRLAQVPFGLTDRADGTVWYFSGNDRASEVSPAVPRLAWNTEVPGGGLFHPTVHSAYSEPVLSGTQLRIFVRGGRLGFEQVNTHVYSGPRWTAPHIVRWFAVRYELKTPVGFSFPLGRLAFETTPEW